MSKHTPGPWRYDCGNSQIECAQYGTHYRQPIANICREDDRFSREVKYIEEADDNAELIAAAPDMYEALKTLDLNSLHFAGRNSEIIKKAIAKAEGK